jgi:hypothetical protein
MHSVVSILTAYIHIPGFQWEYQSCLHTACGTCKYASIHVFSSRNVAGLVHEPWLMNAETFP